ncbi:MAG: hypothetical protein HKN22_07080 [Bacteroidia bacterium]|nr:hypothetical protein [Bacteroidia bacterium]
MDNMPLYELLTRSVSNIGSYILYCSGAILIIGGSIFLNNIINSFDASEKRSYLPGLFYAMIMCLFPEWMIFHPLLIINLLSMYIASKVLQIYRDPENLSLNFDIGILTGISALIYFPSIYLLLFFFAASFTLRPFYWRDWATAFIGLLTPFFFMVLFYFFNDQLEKSLDLLDWYVLIPNPANYDLSKKISIGLIAIIIAGSCFSIANYYYKSITVTRNTQVVVLVFMAVCLLIAVLSGVQHSTRYLITAAPLAMLISYFALNIKNSYLSDSLILILFLLLLFNHLYVYILPF